MSMTVVLPPLVPTVNAPSEPLPNTRSGMNAPPLQLALYGKPRMRLVEGEPGDEWEMKWTLMTQAEVDAMPEHPGW